MKVFIGTICSTRVKFKCVDKPLEILPDITNLVNKAKRLNFLIAEFC